MTDLLPNHAPERPRTADPDISAQADAFFDDPVGVLAGRGDRPFLIDDGDIHSAAAIAHRVAARCAELGSGRRLVAVEAEATVDFVVTYLAAIQARHAVVPLSPGSTAALIERYDPDTVVHARDSRPSIDLRHSHPRHRLHEDLALLLSTSGSTGSPKLVRLARSSLAANAASIATYLGLGVDDVAITSLPLSYCYGLSVLHAHAVVGAPIVLADHSVVDDAFWDLVRAHGVTNLAGVPHTFELIERIGLDRIGASGLRVVTQAGGRLEPERVASLTATGARDGWQLVVMYGQTEATARMAYLPPELAAAFPDRVGVAIPGGSFEIRPFPDREGAELPPGAGRVIYRGPNVMMGYAEDPADLARDRDLDELATGDIGRIDQHGLLEIVGREHRFAKLFGLRVDLQRIEAELRSVGVVAACASDDERLAIAVESGPPAPVTEIVTAMVAIPERCIEVVAVDELPRLATGKVDYRGVLELGAAPIVEQPTSVAGAFCAVLNLDHVSGRDSFVSLNGDSLSYVAMTVRLEEILGTLTHDWHELSVDELQARRADRPRRIARVETSVALRAVAICLVVSSHIRLAYVPFGAHLLLAISGFNFARFQLRDTDATGWAATVARPFAKVALITSAWIGFSMAVWGRHGIESVLLVNNYLGNPAHTDWRWHYWYLEVLVQIGVILALVFALPGARRLERHHPLTFVALLVLPALLLRFDVVTIGGTRNDIFRTDTVIWLFLLGWAMQRARGWWQRGTVVAVTAMVTPGFFFHDDRSARLLVALLILAAIPWLPVPRPLNRLVGWLASASLTIYLTHYAMIRPLRAEFSRATTFVVIIAVGLTLSAVSSWAAGYARSRLAARRDGVLEPAR